MDDTSVVVGEVFFGVEVFRGRYGRRENPRFGMEYLPTEVGGGFKYFLFSPLFGEMIHILTNIFQMG